MVQARALATALRRYRYGDGLDAWWTCFTWPHWLAYVLSALGRSMPNCEVCQLPTIGRQS